MAWTCERCGRSFDRTGQSHSCSQRSLEEAFSGQGGKWRGLYGNLKERVEARVGEFSEHCPSTGIMWKHSSTFAMVKFKRNFMEVEFVSDRLRMERNPSRWLKTSANRVAHSVEVIDETGFDDIIDWIEESYVLTGK